MLMRAPLVETKQDSSIGIEDLPKVIMRRKDSRLTEQRLVPLEAARHVAYTYDRPRALHRVPLCLWQARRRAPKWPRLAKLVFRFRGDARCVAKEFHAAVALGFSRTLRPNLAPKHRGKRIAVFPAGFHDFSSEAFSDFDRFGNAAAFGHQSRNIRAGTQIAAILQILDANPNGHFLDFRDVLLPLHGRFLRKAL